MLRRHFLPPLTELLEVLTHVFIKSATIFTDKYGVLSASPREPAAIRPQVDRSEVNLNNGTTPGGELIDPAFLGGPAG